MTLCFESPEEARRWCRSERDAGRSIGFVPTMGALHAGHLALAHRALAENERVVVSIFVNPLQFNDPGDLERYPRDFAADAALLEEKGVSMVFTGTLEGFFPGELIEGALPEERYLDPGPAAEGLEGAFRPGHFRGVATIVDRLFDVVEPERAYFGQKDYQQCLVVEELARRRGGPRIVVCPTVREEDGLALSSRNLLLDEEGRAAAPTIQRALEAARAAWNGGERDPDRLCEGMGRVLATAPLEVEYAEVRDPRAWSAERPARLDQHAVALIAAGASGRAGSRVRLIDNLILA